jgi:hypothetical protein
MSPGKRNFGVASNPILDKVCFLGGSTTGSTYGGANQCSTDLTAWTTTTHGNPANAVEAADNGAGWTMSGEFCSVGGNTVQGLTDKVSCAPQGAATTWTLTHLNTPRKQHGVATLQGVVATTAPTGSPIGTTTAPTGAPTGALSHASVATPVATILALACALAQ